MSKLAPIECLHVDATTVLLPDPEPTEGACGICNGVFALMNNSLCKHVGYCRLTAAYGQSTAASRENICGGCGRNGAGCTLTKHGENDFRLKSCLKKQTRLGGAKQPLMNAPSLCPVQGCGILVWRYNLADHLIATHKQKKITSPDPGFVEFARQKAKKARRPGYVSRKRPKTAAGAAGGGSGSGSGGGGSGGGGGGGGGGVEGDDSGGDPHPLTMRRGRGRGRRRLG